MAQLRSAWLSARRVAPMTRRRACRCLRQFGSAWLSLAHQAWPARAAPRHCSSAFARPGLAQLGSAWFSLAQRPLREPQDVQARLADLWRFGSAWPSLVQLGSACVTCACPLFGRAATFPCAGLAQLGSVWLSLAQRPAHREPRKSRRDLPCLRQLGSAWLSLAQPGSAGRASARSASAGLLHTPRFGSTWFSLAQPGSAPAARAPWACKCAWEQLRQLGSAWLSSAQLGSVCLSLPSLRAAFRQPLRARVWLSLAQPRSVWRR